MDHKQRNGIHIKVAACISHLIIGTFFSSKSTSYPSYNFSHISSFSRCLHTFYILYYQHHLPYLIFSTTKLVPPPPLFVFFFSVSSFILSDPISQETHFISIFVELQFLTGLKERYRFADFLYWKILGAPKDFHRFQ